MTLFPIEDDGNVGIEMAVVDYDDEFVFDDDDDYDEYDDEYWDEGPYDDGFLYDD